MPPRDNDSVESPIYQPNYKQGSRKSHTTMDYHDKKDKAKASRKSKVYERRKKKTLPDDDASADDCSYNDRHRRKSKSKRKSKSSRNREVGSNNELVPIVNREPAITVSSFLSRQQSMQREADTYSTTGQDNNKMLLTNGGTDDYDNNNNGALVASTHQPTIDVVASDHPSSSFIQTHRTCTVCHRTLCRSQFSERDRYLVHLSIGPGAVCRTCSMTVAATKLKMMPSHAQLLNEYVNRGEYLMSHGQLSAIGYAPDAAEGAMILRENGGDGLNPGNELVPFQPGNNDSETQINPFVSPPASLTMGVDVNAPFSGILSEEERPTHIADCKYIDAVLSMPSYPKLNSMELFSSSKDVSVSMAALDAVKLYGTMDAKYFMAHDANGDKVIPRSMRKKMAANSTNNSAALNKYNPKSIICIVIGEGSLPRTAVLASLHYGWTTLSVDPDLDEDWDGYQEDVPNYTGYSGSISEFMSDDYTESYFELENSESRPNHLVIIGVQMNKDELRLRGNSNINEIRARYDDIPTTLVSMSPLRKATLAPKRRQGQCGSKLEKDVGYEPNCSYIDEGVFSVCRLVEVWNFHNEENGSDQGDSIDDEFSKESIDDGHQLSMEQLSLKDDEYECFQSKPYRQRQNTIDSLKSGSTLSTKGTMPQFDPDQNKKRSDKGKEMVENSLALPISSLLEKENARRKEKQPKSKRKKSSRGLRPVPNDIPEDLEIHTDSFIGDGPPEAEWNREQSYDDAFEHHQIKSNNGSYRDQVDEHHLSNMWKGAVANYDKDSREVEGDKHLHENYHDQKSYESHDKLDYCTKSNSSYDVSSGNSIVGQELEYSGREERIQSDYEDDQERFCHQNEKGINQSEHSSNGFDALKRNTDYFDCGENSVPSSNHIYEDAASESSSNDSNGNGMAALNNGDAPGSDGDDFDDYWSEEEELKPLPTPNRGSKPWHRKDETDKSFVSYDSYEGV